MLEKTAKKIERALNVYNSYTHDRVIFSHYGTSEIARKAIKGKKNLIDMLRKHPNWDEELWAVKVNIKRQVDTSDFPDCSIRDDIERLFNTENDFSHESIAPRIIANWFLQANYFGSSFADDPDQLPSIFEEYCPKAWHKGRKLTKILSCALKEFGVWEDGPGKFQMLFASVCERLKPKKENVTLFLSVHPAHFLTMSNPKNSMAGDMLTSCHSLNNYEYKFANGCSGYAADDVTMIAFTVSDPENENLQYYRKTSRQLFMYKPGSGVLIQSRMYNSEGGTKGGNIWSEDYLKAVQSIINVCEGKDRKWETDNYDSKAFGFTLIPSSDFGGYPDWLYRDFCPHISVDKNVLPLEGEARDWYCGTAGTCLYCGKEITKKVYCVDCRNTHYCEHCGSYEFEEVHTVHLSSYTLENVCDRCLHYYFEKCSDCGE